MQRQRKARKAVESGKRSEAVVSPRSYRGSRQSVSMYRGDGWRVCAAVSVAETPLFSEYREAMCLADCDGGSFLVMRCYADGETLVAELPAISVIGMWAAVYAPHLLESVCAWDREISPAAVVAASPFSERRIEAVLHDPWEGAASSEVPASTSVEVSASTSAEDIDEILGGASVLHSVYSDDYQGVIAEFGRNYRLIVNASFRRFTVQRRTAKGAPVPWLNVNGASAMTKATLLSRCDLSGLRRVAKSLPEKPRDALPDFVRFRSAQAVAYELCDWRRADYRRVLARVGGWRITLDPDGVILRLMRLDTAGESALGFDSWKLQKHFKEVGALRAWLLAGPDQPDMGQLAASIERFNGDLSDVELPSLPTRPRKPLRASAGR